MTTSPGSRRTVGCWPAAIRASAARELFSRQRVDGWSFDAEVLFLCRRAGLEVVEVPVRWTNRGDSRVRLRTAILESLADLLKIRSNALQGLYDRAP